MIEAIDSHYQAVRNRIITLNPNRNFGGVMDAQDWPTVEQQIQAFYLLVLGFTPLHKQAYSPSALPVSHMLQWVWLIQGTDIQKGVVGASRGDRYRIGLQMQLELLNGLYPYFTQKLSWSVDENTGAVTGVPMNPKESVLWTPPTLHSRTDKASGLVYSAAAVNLTNLTDTIAA